MHPLLRQAILLDTETLGLHRGAGMHELAILDLESKRLRSWVFDPNTVEIQPGAVQEHTRLASAATDRAIRHERRTWMEIINLQMSMDQQRRIDLNQTLEEFQRASPWLAKQARHHPHLFGLPDNQQVRVDMFRQLGIEARLGQRGRVQDVLANELASSIKGKTVWIANAVFEAKQIGAQLAAEDPQVARAFKSTLETFNPDSPDPFYVTGSEVTKARTIAQRTGDFTGVWKAYLQNTPRAGETAVRDIQDVLRAMHSYGKKLGLTELDAAYMGTGIDVSHRMMALSDGDTARANMPEFHRAAEDLAIHERYVLENAVEMTSALQELDEGRGQQLLAQAETGEGPLARAARYFASLEAHAPHLREEALTKRLGRAYEQLETEGVTYQRVGDRTFRQQQQTPGGESVYTYRSLPERVSYTSMGDFMDALDAEGRYGQEARQVWDQAPTGVEQVRRWVTDRTEQLRAAHPDSFRDTLGRLGPRRSVLARAGAELVASTPVRYLGLAAAVTAFAGAAASPFQTTPDAPESILHYGYDRWQENQRIEGLGHGPVGAENRKMTDFGSPYQGPTGVEQVFIDQQLLREREKWLRAQYGATHHDPSQLRLFGGFRFGSGNRYIHAGTPTAGKAWGMRGNLMALDIEDGWEISAEDADTVVVKRGGVRGGLSSFFGLNRGYSFRLAGVDSPETSHGAQSYHAPQPGAEASAQALRQILASSGSTTLVFDPSQMTYGRMMGAVIADGRNVNFELVKRGLAAHLPFGKRSDAIIDYASLKKAETKAYQAQRGMWSQPWARAFYEHSEASGNRVTFNTLAKTSSIVQNQGTMQMLSMMEGAQRDGQWGERQTLVARELGSSYHVGADRVEPFTYQAPARPSQNYMTEQLQDLSNYVRTHGTGHRQNKFSARGNYGKLDQTMVLDTMGTSDNIWTKRRYASFRTYNSAKALAAARKHRAAAGQRQALKQMRQSPIGHSRM